MGDHVDITAMVKADALNRAIRTLWQGFGFDAVSAIGAGALILANDIPVESALFWQSLGVLAIKSVVVSAASYMARLKIAPKTPITGG